MYACLAGLPINKLPLAAITSTLVAYFSHDIPTVRLSAQNAAQFLIPVVDSSQKHFFFLSSADVAAFLNASEKDMSASSLLKLFYMYGQIPKNSELFLQQGVFYYSYAVMFRSPRAIEKRLAFSVILMLSSSYQESEEIVKDEVTQENTATITQGTPSHADNSFTTQSVAKRNLTDVLTEMSKQAQSFMTALNQDCGKATFQSFRALLKDFEKEHIVSSNSQLHEASISERISSVLQNITIVLLEGMCVPVY